MRKRDVLIVFVFVYGVGSIMVDSFKVIHELLKHVTFFP